MIGFGVPTSGLNNDELIVAVKGQPNQVLIESLCLGPDGQPSEYLASLDQRFERTRRDKDHKIVHFYETRKSDERGKPVNGKKELRVDGRFLKATDDDKVEYWPLSTDHSGMVKYNGPQDPIYSDVKEHIRAMVTEVVKMSKTEEEEIEGREQQAEMSNQGGKEARRRPEREKGRKGKGRAQIYDH